MVRTDRWYYLNLRGPSCTVLMIGGVLISGYRTAYAAGVGYALDGVRGVVEKVLQIAMVMAS